MNSEILNPKILKIEIFRRINSVSLAFYLSEKALDEDEPEMSFRVHPDEAERYWDLLENAKRNAETP